MRFSLFRYTSTLNLITLNSLILHTVWGSAVLTRVDNRRKQRCFLMLLLSLNAHNNNDYFVASRIVQIYVHFFLQQSLLLQLRLHNLAVNFRVSRSSFHCKTFGDTTVYYKFKHTQRNLRLLEQLKLAAKLTTAVQSVF